MAMMIISTPTPPTTPPISAVLSSDGANAPNDVVGPDAVDTIIELDVVDVVDVDVVETTTEVVVDPDIGNVGAESDDVVIVVVVGVDPTPVVVDNVDTTGVVVVTVVVVVGAGGVDDTPVIGVAAVVGFGVVAVVDTGEYSGHCTH